MHSILPFAFVALVIGVGASPQFGGFGGFGVPKITPPSVIGSGSGSDISAISDPTEVLRWTNKIQDLVDLVRTTLTDMGEIAFQDNPEVGSSIVTTLNGEIAKAAQILVDYSTKVATSGGRLKRAIDNGKKAYNDVGGVMVNSNKKIDSDKKKLSPNAQKKINKKHRNGVEKCQADPCKNAAKVLKDADEGERQ